MAHQNSAMRAGVTSYSPEPEVVDTNPSDQQPPGVDEDDDMPQSLEAALLGTGIVKGPFNYNKKLNKWDMGEDGARNYNPLEVRVPRIEFVSCWDFYPAPSSTSIEECEYIVHRHKMNKSQLPMLGKCSKNN